MTLSGAPERVVEGPSPSRYDKPCTVLRSAGSLHARCAGFDELRLREAHLLSLRKICTKHTSLHEIFPIILLSESPLPFVIEGMRILMFTNAYAPLVGGVSTSVRLAKQALEQRGHQVRLIAPSYDQPVRRERGVRRVTSLHNVLKTAYSLPLPSAGLLQAVTDDFHPDVIHVHHPLLLGTTGAQLAAAWNVPLVYTYHTRFEHYMHYVGDSPLLQSAFLATFLEFMRYCDVIIAPAASAGHALRDMGVTAPIAIVPSACDTQRLARGDGARFRKKHDIPAEAFVAGTVSRLDPEKNVQFLMAALCTFLDRAPDAIVVIVGDGTERSGLEAMVAQRGHTRRVRFTGMLKDDALADAYAALSTFAYASRSETQGIVFAEALSMGVPVVALHAPGATDAIQDRVEGFLVNTENEGDFAKAILAVRALPPKLVTSMSKAARSRARLFAPARHALALEYLYSDVIARHPGGPASPASVLEALRRTWLLWSAPLQPRGHHFRHNHRLS